MLPARTRRYRSAGVREGVEPDQGLREQVGPGPRGRHAAGGNRPQRRSSPLGRPIQQIEHGQHNLKHISSHTHKGLQSHRQSLQLFQRPRTFSEKAQITCCFDELVTAMFTEE